MGPNLSLAVRHLSVSPRRMELDPGMKALQEIWESSRRGISRTWRLDGGAIPAFLPERLIPAGLRSLLSKTHGGE